MTTAERRAIRRAYLLDTYERGMKDLASFRRDVVTAPGGTQRQQVENATQLEAVTACMETIKRLAEEETTS